MASSTGYREYIRRLPEKNSLSREDPYAAVRNILLTQQGVVIQAIQKRKELVADLESFFLGNKHIIVIGGESGMGKSLFGAELRTLHQNVQYVMPGRLRTQLSVITWDRTHQVFFEEISTILGTTVPLPRGETHIKARNLISSVLGDQIRFIKKYIGPKTRIIIEAPLIGFRGESLFEELKEYKNEMLTFIMHSPKMRYESFKKGRLMLTSGQPESMASIREHLLLSITKRRKVSHDYQDHIVKEWWAKRIQHWGRGALIEWDPDDNRSALEETVAQFMKANIAPDVLSPRPIGRFTRNHIESILYSQSNTDRFLKMLCTNSK